MAKPHLEPGTTLDGFHIVKLAHKGGMAVMYEVTHPDHIVPLLMKIPMLHEGEDPAAIVSFEMEQMIMPRLSGLHVPRLAAHRCPPTKTKAESALRAGICSKNT